VSSPGDSPPIPRSDDRQRLDECRHIRTDGPEAGEEGEEALGRERGGQHQYHEPRTQDGNSDDHYAEADEGYQIFALGHWRPPCFEAPFLALLRFPMTSRGGKNGFVLTGGAGHAGGFFYVGLRLCRLTVSLPLDRRIIPPRKGVIFLWGS
jgi:hypothetical protein